MSNYVEKAKFNPSKKYHHPHEVVADEKLSAEEKLAILKNWEDEARLRLIAEDENMPSPFPQKKYDLNDIIEAIIIVEQTQIAKLKK